MAAGLPLIVTRSGGIEEYTSPECAVIVERDGQIVESLSRAIVSLQRNPDRCNKMSQAGLARAQLYGMRSMYQQLLLHVNNRTASSVWIFHTMLTFIVIGLLAMDTHSDV